jgi:hypothetical protein
MPQHIGCRCDVDWPRHGSGGLAAASAAFGAADLAQAPPMYPLPRVWVGRGIAPIEAAPCRLWVSVQADDSVMIELPSGYANRGFTPQLTRLLRRIVFTWYGEACACCGITERLTIDHIDGTGQEHRQRLFGGAHGGNVFYHWLIRQSFPPGYQTLCRPCNIRKRRRARCDLPHGVPSRKCSRCRKMAPLTDFPPGKRRCSPCRAADATRWSK